MRTATPSRLTSWCVLLVAIVGFAAVSAQAQDDEVVVLNGRVMDPETAYDAVANVGVKDGRIRLLMDSVNIVLIMKDGNIYKNTL